MSTAPFLIPIATFAPEPFEIILPLGVIVRPEGDSFVASLFDANVNASGETIHEVIVNLKSLILDSFVRLEAKDDGQLGPAMIRQKAVLQSLIRRKAVGTGDGEPPKAAAEPDEIARLKADLAAMTEDRNAYAKAGLVGLSGIVCTPEKGYVKDGGAGGFMADMRKMREKLDLAQRLAQCWKDELGTYRQENERLNTELLAFENLGVHQLGDRWMTLNSEHQWTNFFTREEALAARRKAAGLEPTS